MPLKYAAQLPQLPAQQSSRPLPAEHRHRHNFAFEQPRQQQRHTSVEMKAIINKLRILRGRSPPSAPEDRHQAAAQTAPSARKHGVEERFANRNTAQSQLLVTSGSSVPSNTTSIAATSKTCSLTAEIPATTAHCLRVSELVSTRGKQQQRTTNHQYHKGEINIPRAGSEANACTDTSTPDAPGKSPADTTRRH